MKRPAPNWKKTFMKYTLDKKLEFRVYRKVIILKLNGKKANIPEGKNWQKILH
jgi:hypothetical protein